MQATEDEKTGAFARALQSAMVQGGWTLGRLAAASRQAPSPVSAPTLRSWLSGSTEPSRRASFEAVRELEIILGLGSGLLQRHLESAARPQLRSGIGPLSGADLDALMDLRREWGHDSAVAADRIFLGADLHLGADGTGDLVHTLVARAVHDGAQRVMLVVDLECRADAVQGEGNAQGSGDPQGAGFAGGAAEPFDPELFRAEGVAITRAVRARGGLAAIELTFPRPLEAAEPCFATFSIPVRAADPAHGTLHVLSFAPTGVLSARVTHDAPTHRFRLRREWARADQQDQFDGKDEFGRPLETTGHCVLSEIDAGLAAVTWERGTPLAF